jgi:uncharacterized protein (TIGR02145 family)
MKKIFTFFIAFALSAAVYAQVPQQFSYQAVVRGANNTLLTNQKVGVKISLLKGSENGQSVYVEQHIATSNTNGLISISVGGGTLLSGDFIKIDWANGPYFVKSEIDPEGGSNYTLATTAQLLAVPYALYAANSQPGPKGEKGDQGTPGKDGMNGKDGKVEFQNLRVSATGDTLFLTNGNFVIIPGLSSANTTTKPTSGYGPSIKDIDGNEYKTVYIGTQQWMGENLKVSRYNDGSEIQNITENADWMNLSTGAWCYYNNDVTNNLIYGKLYNWFAVSPTTNGSKNVCPFGWHVPSDVEWSLLTDFLGGENVAGGKIKEEGIINWLNPNNQASNITLFTAVPGGFRDNGGNSNFIGAHCYMWSSTNATLSTAIERELSYGNGSLIKTDNSKKYGFSVRCIKD